MVSWQYRTLFYVASDTQEEGREGKGDCKHRKTNGEGCQFFLPLLETITFQNRNLEFPKGLLCQVVKWVWCVCMQEGIDSKCG